MNAVRMRLIERVMEGEKPTLMLLHTKSDMSVDSALKSKLKRANTVHKPNEAASKVNSIQGDFKGLRDL